MRILVVEDSSATRTYVRASLESAADWPDIEVVEATGGFEALRLLPRGPYDLVIADINMPDINGLELLSFIRSNDAQQSTPVILVSTQAGAKDRERGLSLGAASFLTKPFTQEELLREVGRLITPSEPDE